MSKTFVNPSALRELRSLVSEAHKLTREGQRFYWMMEDMQGLRAWLEENHPSPKTEADDSDN